MADLLEERLRSHADAFNGLLDLIPAKMYFSQDTSDQWKKRKQTKEESQQAKRAKLDPDTPVSVKEVNDAKEAKRQGILERKKAKTNGTEEKKELEKQMKAELRRRKEAKKEKAKAAKVAGVGGETNGTPKQSESTLKAKKEKTKPKSRTTGEKSVATNKSVAKMLRSPSPVAKVTEKDVNMEDAEEDEAEETDPIAMTNTLITEIIHGKSDDDKEEIEEYPASDIDRSSELDDAEDAPITALSDLTAEEEASTSVSPVHSIASSAPTSTSSTASIKVSKDPVQQAQLKERLAKRIEELREKRKADSGPGPRNRSELLDQRRKRDEARKERKKQMRIQTKAEESKTSTSTTIASLPSVNGTKSSATPAVENNFSFSLVSFSDGAQLNPTLSSLQDTKKRKGPTDAVAMLKQSEDKKARLASMPDDKREHILEKDRWDKALKLASGEKVRDDEGLLKKSVKRMEGVKRKSEKEWNERKAGVAKSKHAKQKKRDDNLQKRKDEKTAKRIGGNKAKAKAKKAPGGAKKKKGRAGFEGSGFGGKGKK